MKLVADSDLLSVDWLCYKGFTANATVVRGKLVMGAGFAKQVRNALPNIDIEFGRIISNIDPSRSMNSILQKREQFSGIRIAWDYHVAFIKGNVGLNADPKFDQWFAFQTKRFFRHDSDLDLIAKSCNVLTRIANETPDKKFGFNYPGIGLGNLQEKDVQPLLETLPNNVFVFTFGGNRYGHK